MISENLTTMKLLFISPEHGSKARRLMDLSTMVVLMGLLAKLYSRFSKDGEDLIANTKHNESRVVQLQEFFERGVPALLGGVPEYMQKLESIKVI
nr:unnamed protein product [Callosobruchus chinensis]